MAMLEKPAILRPVPGELTGDRVIVRPFTDEDAEALYTAILESVEHLRPWMPWYDKHKSVEDTLVYIRRTQSQSILRENFEMGIFADGGRCVGGAGLHVHTWDVPSLEIGYWIRRSSEGKGYVAEAARLLTACAFETLEAQRVVIRCDARNIRSARVAERLGYLHEGTMRHAERNTSGDLTNMRCYSMLRDEYQRTHQQT